MFDVTHNHFRELISAGVDGELDAADQHELDAHLETCASCLAYQKDAWALRRALRLQPVQEPTAADTPSSVDVGPLGGMSMLRWALFVIGATLVVLNLQALVTVDGTVAAHLNRHDAVFGTALGIGMLAVAAKPHRAIGLVPLTSAIAVLMAVVAIGDLIAGNATMLAEAIHVVEFGGLICLWVISGGPSRLHRRVDSLGHRLSARSSGSVPEWPTA